MTPIELKNKLHSGEQVLGTLIVSPSPFWPKAIAGCGLDFVFIDTEHIALDRTQVSWMCRTYAAVGLPPLVRITSPNPYDATMVLDDGAAGVIAPYLESKEQVIQLRGATKIRPLKGKIMNDILSGSKISPGLSKYLTNFNESHILIANIESVPALNALDEILDVPGLDAVLIGSHDLSCSLDVPEQYDDPLFLKTVETIFKKARDKGIGAGIHAWSDLDGQVRLVNMGANMLIHKADIIFAATGLKNELAEIREKLGIESASQSANDVNI